jgi:hypothetical protein
VERQLQGITSLSAFPKSGVTYLSFLLFHSLFADDCDIRDLERKYVLDVHTFPNATFGDPRAPRLIKLHSPYNPAIPAVRLTSKAIYLIRHPIDVMMSAWDYESLLQGDVRETQSPAFRAFVGRWLLTGGAVPVHGSWLQHVRSWHAQSSVPLHLVRYEDIVDNPERELAAILGFLGIAVPAERQRFAIERSSMKSMAAFEATEVESKADGIFYNRALARGYGQGHRFVNKGYRKSYETLLTAEERAIADKTFGAEIARYLANRT